MWKMRAPNKIKEKREKNFSLDDSSLPPLSLCGPEFLLTVFPLPKERVIHFSQWLEAPWLRPGAPSERLHTDLPRLVQVGSPRPREHVGMKLCSQASRLGA